jgi:hypothetical protein
MALMEEFKTPGKTILNCPAFGEAILVVMDDFEYNYLKTVCEDLGETF